MANYRSHPGIIDGLLGWVNRSNEILYEVVIPRLFKALYKVEEYQGPRQVVRKLLIKGDNMLDDPVTLAKKAYASRMAEASGMGYVLIPGSAAARGLIGY